MSAKGEFVVLRRVRGGDEDLVATLYGPPGRSTLFVREGYLPESPFFGLFEPFNVVKLSYRQAGNILVPEDFLGVERLSYLATDPERLSYMSRLSGFVLKRVSFYDEPLFRLLTSYLKKRPSPSLLLRFKLDFLKLSGVLPKFLEERKLGGGSVNLKDGSSSKEGFPVGEEVLTYLRKLYRSSKPERIKLPPPLLRRAEELLERYMDYHALR